MDLLLGAERCEGNGEMWARRALKSPVLVEFEDMARAADFFTVAAGLRALAAKQGTAE